jgi:signal transduction histidine kinase
MGQAGSTRPRRTVYRRLCAALLSGLPLIGAATSDAQSPVKQILVLQSVPRGNLTLDAFTGEFRARLDQRAGEPVNVVQIVVGPTGLVGAPEQAIVDYIRSIYTNRAGPDLIMTVAGPAAVFARKYRQQLFPRTPLLFAATDQRYLRGVPLGENESAVTVANDFPRLIDGILRILPETRQIFMVTGSGATSRFMRPELEAGFARFHDRVTFVWSDRMSFPEILQAVARLPARAAIVFETFGTDAQGRSYTADEVIAGLHDRANAPLFAAQSPYLGHGVVGGSAMDIDGLARRTADVAGRILDGEAPNSFRVPPLTAGQPTFDWRELRRWGIPESRLPPGSVVKFRGPTLWEEHRVTVLTGVGALVLQSFLIALLLYERRARQRAEVDSRRNLALATDANRRETISALTASMGHELGQPLTAIAHNTQALQLMVAADRPAPDATAEILADINAQSVLATQIIERHRSMLRGHHLDKKPLDLHAVIDETLALFAHDMRARRIEATLELSSTPCVIDGDRVLLEQVLVNLVRNAMDALADAPPARRHIAIGTAISDADVEISVRDTGTGLPAEIIGTLFTPFVTTKSHGLGVGLTIAQRIVEAHAGTIAAHQNDDGGATFTVTLPRVAASGSARASDSARLPVSRPGRPHAPIAPDR